MIAANWLVVARLHMPSHIQPLEFIAANRVQLQVEPRRGDVEHQGQADAISSLYAYSVVGSILADGLNL